MPCEPAPPCEPNFPLFCEALPTTTDARRVVVEDAASCQKTIQTPLTPGVLSNTSAGVVEWEGGSTGSVLQVTAANDVEFVNGSSTQPFQIPLLQTHTPDNVPNVIVMLADGTVKKWDPTNVGNNFIAYWDGGDWRINTLNSLLPSGNGSVFIRDNSGNLQAITGNANDILKMVGSTPAFVTSGAAAAFPAGHLYGMILSNNLTNPNTTIDVSAGECRDSSASENIVLSSSITKSVSGPFVAGTGQFGMLGGTPVPGPNTTLHVLAIYGASGVDVGFHANPTIPLGSLPSGYDQAYRRIGSILTNAAGAIEPFFQNGDRFLLRTPFKSASTRFQAVTTTGTAITLFTPNGIRVYPMIRAESTSPAGIYMTFYDLDQGLTMSPFDWNPSLSEWISSSTHVNGFFLDISTNTENILTNTNRQIGVATSVNVAGAFPYGLNWDVWGWIDQRNRLQP